MNLDFRGNYNSAENIGGPESRFFVIAEMGRSMLRPYKEKERESADLKIGHYNGGVGTRSFRARGTILNSTGRRARGSPSTWA